MSFESVQAKWVAGDPKATVEFSTLTNYSEASQLVGLYGKTAGIGDDREVYVLVLTGNFRLRRTNAALIFLIVDATTGDLFSEGQPGEHATYRSIVATENPG